MSNWMGLSFQNGASPMMEQLILFHDHIMITITVTVTVVLYFMVSMALNSFVNRALLEGHNVEVIWTILPAFILFFVAMPSLRLLYLLDEASQPGLTIKVVGHQWYWSYEYSDFSESGFSSYMISESGPDSSDFRLLETDNRLVVPTGGQVRILVTSSDVIHSWTVPALGVKADAVPGRLNQMSFTSVRSGIFYGQCSEICGANHSFMPIVIESVPLQAFIRWMSSSL